LRTILLIPCTDRKRSRPSEELRARNLAPGTLSEVAGEWFERVASAKSKQLHEGVYCGRAYREAANAAKALSAELAVISAGLGVVRADQQIPSYSLTVAPRSEDTVLSKITCDEARPEAWWRALKCAHDGGTAVQDILRSEASTLVLIGLSASYARLIRDDLMNLSGTETERVRIFGAGIAEHLPAHLAASVMPYDARLNGPDSPIPGTMSDFASRALHHYACCLRDGVLSASHADDDRQKLLGQMTGWRTPNTPVRERMTDEEIVRFIHEHWQETGGRSGASLRLLRDSGHACEQSRFRDLFRSASSRRDETEKSAA